MDRRRIVFLDIDGTLIDERQRLSPGVASALARARGNGHLLFLCTGRSPAEIPAVVAGLDFDGTISAGGGFIEHRGELLARHTISAEDVRVLVRFFREHDIEYTLQAHDAVYPSEGLLARVVPLFERRGIDLRDPAGEGARIARRLAHRRPGPETGIAKTTFFGEDETTFARVRDGVGERFHVITGTIPYLGDSGGEVTRAGINKGAAIIQLVDVLGMSADDAIAIGDGSNDLEMLDVVGVGIAMGNADRTVKAVADEITASVHEDGVLVALDAHGLL